MTSDELPRIEELYHAALALPREQRKEFLYSACKDDPALLHEVESLLDARAEASKFSRANLLQRGFELIASQSLNLVGQEIGSYKITSLIGQGGMGAVFAAFDSRLGRRVAIKIFQDSLTGSLAESDNDSYLWHEARAASAITHPNVAQIYEVGDSGERRFIVMEYVDGVTLRSRLSGGPISIEKTVGIACQIAEALSAAHRAGIVHRDIKAENVMLLEDEHIKVLDFGLAKRTVIPFEQHTNLIQQVNSLFSGVSGAVVGTVPYMSPEQASGQPIDARTDLWSLGVVIYEMVSGKLPFEGETAAEVIAGVLDRQPLSLTGAPAELRQIVDRALTKDADRRYQTAPEILRDLKTLRTELAFESRMRSSPLINPPESGYGNRGKTLQPQFFIQNLISNRKTIALLGLLVTTAFLVFKFIERPPEHFLPGQFEVRNFSGVGRALEAAISPDNQFAVFSTEEGGREKLWLKRVATAEKTLLSGAGEAVTRGRIDAAAFPEGHYKGLSISPDGKFLFYSLYDEGHHGKLYRASIPAATDSRMLLDDVDAPFSLSPEGKRVAFIRANQSKPNELILHDIQTGESKALISSRQLVTGSAAWAPNNKLIACAVRVVENGGEFQRVAFYRLSDGAETAIGESRWKRIDQIVWLSDLSGMLLIAVDERSPQAQVWSVAYPSGKSRRITADIGEYRTLSVSKDAALVAAVQSMRSSQVQIYPPSGPVNSISMGKEDGVHGVAWTNDGRIVYTSNASGSNDLWIMSADGRNQRRLTLDGRWDRQPAVCPDNGCIVFVSDRGSSSQVWRVGLDGSGITPLTAGPDDSYPTVTPDGQWVIYGSRVGSYRRLWKVSINGGTPQQLTNYISNWPAVSPDQKYIASLFRPDSGTARIKLAIAPFSGGEPIRLIDLPEGIARPPDLTSAGFRWSRDGRSVYYINTDNGVSNLWSQPIDGKQPMQITNFAAERIFWFDFFPGNGTLTFVRGQYAHDVVLLADQSLSPAKK